MDWESSTSAVMPVVNVAVALVPVVGFLLALQLMDSFKLVRPSSVVRAIAAGAVAAVVSWALHHPLQQLTGLGDAHFSRYLAPVVEETFKALFIVVLIVRRRIGFLVDAAVQGFATFNEKSPRLRSPAKNARWS